MLAVAEASRNVACAGGEGIGATNNLNFGNPERPEIMWQIGEAVRGIGDACRALDVPITGGNVSVYNETEGRIEIRLQSLADQVVRLDELTIPFRRGEFIETEYSYKFTPTDFQALALRAGFAPVHLWTDPRCWFSVQYFAVSA